MGWSDRRSLDDYFKIGKKKTDLVAQRRHLQSLGKDIPLEIQQLQSPKAKTIWFFKEQNESNVAGIWYVWVSYILTCVHVCACTYTYVMEGGKGKGKERRRSKTWGRKRREGKTERITENCAKGRKKSHLKILSISIVWSQYFTEQWIVGMQWFSIETMVTWIPLVVVEIEK